MAAIVALLLTFVARACHCQGSEEAAFLLEHKGVRDFLRAKFRKYDRDNSRASPASLAAWVFGFCVR